MDKLDSAWRMRYDQRYHPDTMDNQLMTNSVIWQVYRCPQCPHYQLLRISATSRLLLHLSVPALVNLSGNQHHMDIIFPLFPSNFTMNFPLSMSHSLKIKSFATTERKRRSNLSIYILCHYLRALLDSIFHTVCLFQH